MLSDVMVELKLDNWNYKDGITMDRLMSIRWGFFWCILLNSKKKIDWLWVQNCPYRNIIGKKQNG